jgi:PAS domain S-box-containing protein
MNRFIEIFFKSPLAKKQLLYILSISFFFTFITSLIQISVEYKRDLVNLEKELLKIKSIYAKTISDCLWQLDFKHLELHLENILTSNHIVHAKLISDKKEMSAGKILSKDKTVTKEYPLTHNYYGKNIQIGSLQITASLSDIYTETLSRAFFTVLIRSLEIFTISLSILFVIYHFFIKNFIRISRYSKNITLDDLHSSSDISLNKRKSRVKDELDELAESLNNMRERLKTELESKNLAEHKLRENEEFLRITLNSITDGVITTNLSGLIVSINPMAKELTGFQPECDDVYSYRKKLNDIFEIYNLNTGLKVPDPFKTAVRFGKAADNFGITVLKSQNGNKYIISYTAVPILNDNSDKKGVVIVFKDLTSIHEKDLRLIEKEKNYRIIFEQSNASIIVVEPDTYKIIDCNKKTFELFEIDPAEIENINFTHFFINGKNILEFQNLTENSQQYESELITLKKKRLFCIVNLQTIERENKTKILAIITDITSIKKMQNKIIESQKMDSIGNLAGGIAHDFNNKLAGILGYASMLEEMEKENEKKEIIQKIIDSAQRSALITKNLLGFAQKGKNIIESFNINQVIEEIVAILKTGISPEKDIFFKINLDTNLHPIDADPFQIKQAIMNVCLNAVEAVENQGEIYIETKNAPKNGIEIRIKDTGKGIPENIKDKIFDPFVTTKNDTDFTKGRGLGLPAAYGIIKNHSGSIEYSSKKGSGTVFKLTFPKGFKKVQPIKAKSELVASKEATILIIEDEEILSTMLENILSA